MGSEDSLVTQPNQLTEPDLVILRIINAQHFDNGIVTRAAFALSSNDNYKLSVNQESRITPGDALEQKSAILRARKESEGKPFTPPPAVARMTVGEIEDIPLPTEEGELQDGEQAALSVWDDSMLEGTPESHAYLDFERTYEPKERRKAVYNRLAAIANQNGKLFLPDH